MTPGGRRPRAPSGSLTSWCERAAYCSCVSISPGVNEPSVTVVYSSLAGLCIMGCGFPLTGGRSRASIGRLADLVHGVLPHRFLCEVKRSFFFSFPFALLCLFCIFFDNKSMFHRLLLHWHFYFSAAPRVHRPNQTATLHKCPFGLTKVIAVSWRWGSRTRTP